MPLDCKLCNTSFSSKLELEEHILLLSHHVKIASTGSQEHNCSECTYNCKSLADYSKHVDSPDHRKRLERLRAKIDTEEADKPYKKMRNNGTDRKDNTYMEPASSRNYDRREHVGTYTPRNAANRYGYGVYRGSPYNNERSSESHRNDYRGYTDRRFFERNSNRASYHGERFPKERHQENINIKERDKSKSGQPSPQNEEPKKTMFQRACSMSMRKKDKLRKPLPQEEPGKVAPKINPEKKTERVRTSTIFSPTRVSSAATAQAPKLKKRNVIPGPIINQHDKQKTWKRIAKSVIGKKQSDLVRRDRASKYRLLDKKPEDLSEEDGILLELPNTLPVLMPTPSSVTIPSLNDSSATYATVANIPMSTPYNYPNAMRSYNSGTADLSRVLGEIEKAKSVAKSTKAGPSSASSTSSGSLPAIGDSVTNTSSMCSSLMLDENTLSSRLDITSCAKPIKDEVEDDYFSITPAIIQPEVRFNPEQDIDNKKNELWDLALEEEIKKNELEATKARVLQLESDLLRIQKRKKELFEL